MQAPKPIASLNVLGEPLSPCSTDPMTGFFETAAAIPARRTWAFTPFVLRWIRLFCNFLELRAMTSSLPDWSGDSLASNQETGGASAQDVGWRRIAKGQLHPFS